MRRLGFFLFTRLLATFAATLFTLVGIAWVSQALRKFDLVTAKGQAIATYLGITLLLIPQIVNVVAPFAFVIALVVVLNHLHAESELIAMTAAGISQRQLLAPILAVAGVVAAIIGWSVMWGDPQAMRSVHNLGNRIRADVVANIIQPGQFTEIEDQFTFHIRDRLGDGTLEGVFIFDDRSPEYSYSYSAKHGRIANFGNRPMVVMESGTVERVRRADHAATLVNFGSYAFDLSQLTPQSTVKGQGLDERTIVELMTLPSDDLGFPTGVIAYETMSRLSMPLYAFAMALTVMLFLGYPKTTRSGRANAVIGALLFSSLLRVAGFALASYAKSGTNDGTSFLVPLPLIAIAALLVAIWLGFQPTMPGAVRDRLAALGQRLRDRFARPPVSGRSA